MGRLLKFFFAGLCCFLVLVSQRIAAQGPKGPVLSGVPSESARIFSMALQNLQREIAANPAPWRDILIVYALVDPQGAKTKVLAGLEQGKKTPLALIDFSFWLQAAWEVFKVTGDKDFLRRIQVYADDVMDRSENKMDAERRYYPVSKDFLVTQLAMAQAWRVLGFTHGVTRFPGRAIYCEQHFQRLRRFLEGREDFQNLSDNVLLTWAQLWDLKPNPRGHLAWSHLTDSSAGMVAVWLRDTFGIALRAFQFEFQPQWPCVEKSKPQLNLPFQKGVLQVTMVSCGEQLKKLVVDGHRSENLIVSDIDRTLSVKLYLE